MSKVLVATSLSIMSLCLLSTLATCSDQPTAVIETTAGNLRCVLFPNQAPIGVANFVGLAEGTKNYTSPVTHKVVHDTPYYDGTTFHRIIPNFMIQGGDPKGDSTGDPGYVFKNETSPDLQFDRPGRLGYANSGPDGTNNSQFFITQVAYPSLNGGYTIFGQCDWASVNLVEKIAHMPRGANGDPSDPVKITHISISSGTAEIGALPQAGETSAPAAAAAGYDSGSTTATQSSQDTSSTQGTTTTVVISPAQQGDAPFNNQCVRVSSVWGTSCNSRTSFQVTAWNACSQPSDIKLCLQRTNGTWDCGMSLNTQQRSNGADPAQRALDYVCQGTGKYLYWSRPSIGRFQSFPNP